MGQRLNVTYDKKPCYDIVYEASFAELPAELEKFETAQKKLCIITDSKVGSLYAEEVKDSYPCLQGVCDLYVSGGGSK